MLINRRGVALMLAGVLFIALVIAACGGSDEKKSAEETETGDEVVVHLHAEEMRFDPEVITVEVGQKVRLKLDNHDPILHDYTSDGGEFQIYASEGAQHGHGGGTTAEEQMSPRPLHVAAEAEENADMVFAATAPGEYVVYCSVTGHRESGMIGTIVVTA